MSAATDLENAYSTMTANACYEQNCSLAEAKLFIAAASLIVIRKPKKIKIDGQEVEVEVSIIENMLNAAKAWYRQKDPAVAQSTATSCVRSYVPCPREPRGNCCDRRR